MTITRQDAERLEKSGFTRQEIMEIAQARTPDGKFQPPVDLNDAAWQKTMNLRYNFNIKLRQDFKRTHKRDLTRAQYDGIVNQWYKGGIRKTPFDWLVEAYGKGKKKVSDFIEARQAFARRTHRDLRRNFGVR